MGTAVITRKPNVKREEVEQIRQLAEAGHSDQELADTFDTWPKVIAQIREGTFHRGGARGPYKKKSTVPQTALKEIMQNIYDTKAREIEQAKNEIEDAKRRLEMLTSDIEYLAAKNFLHACTIQEAKL